jgi:uncharacterized protein
MDGKVDLDAVEDYLNSDLAPDNTMDLSELDGFLTAVALSPEPIPPEEWVMAIFDDDPPDFEDEDHADAVLGGILARFNEIMDGLDTGPPDFAPIFWQQADGRTVAEDWAVGFMHAVSMRAMAWEPVLDDDDSAMLLIPIAALAGLSGPEETFGTVPLPEEVMDRLIDEAPDTLVSCALGLRRFWRDRFVSAVRH